MGPAGGPPVSFRKVDPEFDFARWTPSSISQDGPQGNQGRQGKQGKQGNQGKQGKQTKKRDKAQSNLETETLETNGPAG